MDYSLIMATRVNDIRYFDGSNWISVLKKTGSNYNVRLAVSNGDRNNTLMQLQPPYVTRYSVYANGDWCYTEPFFELESGSLVVNIEADSLSVTVPYIGNNELSEITATTLPSCLSFTYSTNRKTLTFTQLSTFISATVVLNPNNGAANLTLSIRKFESVVV